MPFMPPAMQSAFIQKSPEEVDFIQSVKVDHRSIPAGTEIIYMGQEDAELFTLFKGWAPCIKLFPTAGGKFSIFYCLETLWVFRRR